MKKYTFIDLFSGIGGFHIGMTKAGANFLLACENNEFSRKTYLANFSKNFEKSCVKNPFLKDISQIDIERDIPHFNILCAGFPCQPFSNSGLKKGFEDSRGNMFLHIRDILKQKQPEAFFLENVRGLLNHDDGKTFLKIQEIITQEINYSFHFKVFKGTDFGVPQLRPRIYMVGFKNDKTVFNFPQTQIKLNKTMSDIFGGQCNRDIGFTMRVGGRGSHINDRRNWDSYMVEGQVRRLTPKEGLQLNGFPENFVFPVSPSQAMKQLGNSVIVPAIEAIGKEIIKSLNI